MGRGRDPRAEARAQLRETRAVYLRAILRKTYQEIADSLFPCPAHERINGSADCPDCERMYTNRGTAQRAVQRALRRDYDASAGVRDELRSEQLASINPVLKQAIRDSLDQRASIGERARASLAAVRLWERQAKLTGLDAPTRVTVDEGLDEDLRVALAALADTPLPTPEQLREA